jgi:hypothetical protein
MRQKSKTILHFDNVSKDKPLTFVAFYLKEQNEENIKVLKNQKLPQGLCKHLFKYGRL